VTLSTCSTGVRTLNRCTTVSWYMALIIKSKVYLRNLFCFVLFCFVSKLQKVSVKFRQFLRRRPIVYLVCTQATGFMTKVAVFVCVTLKGDNFKKFQHLV